MNVDQLRDRTAAAIRARRAYVHISQDELADAAGLSRSTIHRIESGTRTVDLAQLAAIADALDTTAVELVASITDQETPCRSTA